MQAAADIADRLNLTIDDALILQCGHTALLAAAARGEIDLNQMARDVLASRGLDQHGRWVGAERAAAIHAR